MGFSIIFDNSKDRMSYNKNTSELDIAIYDNIEQKRMDLHVDATNAKIVSTHFEDKDYIDDLVNNIVGSTQEKEKIDLLLIDYKMGAEYSEAIDNIELALQCVPFNNYYKRETEKKKEDGGSDSTDHSTQAPCKLVLAHRLLSDGKGKERRIAYLSRDLFVTNIIVRKSCVNNFIDQSSNYE